MSITSAAEKRHTDHHVGVEHALNELPATFATRTPPHTASAGRSHTFVTTMLDAGLSLRGVQRRPPRRPTHHHALRPGPQEPRPSPNYSLAACMASGT
jgi:hypothetical protein